MAKEINAYSDRAAANKNRHIARSIELKTSAFFTLQSNQSLTISKVSLKLCRTIIEASFLEKPEEYFYRLEFRKNIRLFFDF